jgi:hypothetical protein
MIARGVATNGAIPRFERLLLAGFFWRARMGIEGVLVDTNWRPSEIEPVHAAVARRQWPCPTLLRMVQDAGAADRFRTALTPSR